MEKEKVCKQCGTTNEEDFVKKNDNGSWINICTKCDSENRSNRVKGKNHPNWNGGPNHQSGKCKHCGTEIESDFIRKNGKIGLTICTKCISKNRSGKNNFNFNPNIIHIIKGVCKHCGTTEGLIVDKIGRIWSVCKDCNRSQHIKSQTGRKFTDIAKLNMSLAAKDKIITSKTRQLMSIAGKNKKISKLQRDKISKSNKGKHSDKGLRLKDYIEKYPWLTLFEELRDNPNIEIGKAKIQVRCKKCNNWFTPTHSQLSNRILELKNNRDGCYFYCSDSCKNSCPLFGLKVNNFLNNLNRSDTDPIQNSPEYTTFRNEVLARQRKEESDSCYNHCEICNSESNLHVHHEHPVKTHPHLALDPDNGIILCSSCHYTIGHQDNCSTSSLANKICVPININNEII